MIIRKKYLKRIEEFYHNQEFIKVLVGMRRTGKSTILKQIENHLLKEGVNPNNIHSINFESLEFEELKDYKLLYKYFKDRIKNKKLNYIFIDEIQNVDMFEKTINSLKVDFNVSIFITGSNSNLLSGELATLLAGRYRLFNIYPFSFNEWLEVKCETKNEDLLWEYLTYGGLPQIAKIMSLESKVESLKDILDSIIYRDIISSVEIKNTNALKRLISYIIQNSSETFSAQKILNTFKTAGVSITKNTIYDYFERINNSLVTYECKKNDLQGRKVLTKLHKLYVNDLGFRYINSPRENNDYSKIIETSVFNHLKYLGYNITTGSINGFEIDFVVNKNEGDKKINKYIQVSHKLDNENTIDREFRPFHNLEDGYERFIITTDVKDQSRDGVKHINLLDFLSDDKF